ncbi:hypothetical protein AVEN_75238-1 [Araneus ventricosus]|uniref:Uncharacterized protein n=1 Tax=Araneus ventricosus TaxID=182803 RepID=A0A4Y2P6Y7_ARAVE|nr:hypothetical protein AVEN_75238-1 [Araneus ventricosus]
MTNDIAGPERIKEGHSQCSSTFFGTQDIPVHSSLRKSDDYWRRQRKSLGYSLLFSFHSSFGHKVKDDPSLPGLLLTHRGLGGMGDVRLGFLLAGSPKA